MHFACLSHCSGLNAPLFPKKRYVLLKPVNMTLFGKMVFADAIKISRWDKPGLGWVQNLWCHHHHHLPWVSVNKFFLVLILLIYQQHLIADHFLFLSFLSFSNHILLIFLFFVRYYLSLFCDHFFFCLSHKYPCSKGFCAWSFLLVPLHSVIRL